MSTDELHIETVEGVGAVSADAWNHLVASESPFLEYGFLHTLEVAGCLEPESGWRPSIVVAYDDDQLVGAVPLYRKMNSEGEFVFDFSWAEGSTRAGIDYYPKAVVAVPYTPVTGARILVSSDHSNRRDVAEKLVDATLDIADERQWSSVHFNFILPGERSLFETRGLPIRRGMQYHWKNEGFEETSSYRDFDHFLARFRSKKRSNIRRERRKLDENDVTTQIKRGSEIDEGDMRRMFRYYLDTVEKHLYGRQYLTEEFFLRIQTALSDRLHMVFAHQDGEPFAGALNLCKEKRLYGRYWGGDREVNFAHFETCIYRPVQWCIEHGIEVFEPGAGGEHKFDRGFEPVKTYSAHYIRDPRLRRAIEDFIERESRAIEGRIKKLRGNSPLK